jgi:hypothetical protein
MALLHKLLAVYLFVVGFLAWGLLIATPLYHDGSPEYPHWQLLNYFMAAGVLIVLVKGFLMRRVHAHAVGECTNMLEHLRVSMAFYGSIVLSMLFYWEWFWTLNPESETGDAVTSHLIYFPMVDALFVVICLLVGRRFWGEGNA